MRRLISLFLIHPWISISRLVFLLALPLFFSHALSAQIEDPTESYWLFSADGRLRHLLPADINQDGIDEFLTVDESGKIDMLQSDGSRAWSFEAQDAVLEIGTLNIHGSSRPDREVMFATSNRLFLLSSTGNLLWQTPIHPLTTPDALLTSGGMASESDWLNRYSARPAAIAAINTGSDGVEEILLLLGSGQLQRYDVQGNLRWVFNRNSNPLSDTGPQMTVADFDGDGRSDIALGFFDDRRRFSQLSLIDETGQSKWEDDQPISGRISTLTAVSFGTESGQYIAVGTNQGQIDVYTGNRERIWQRTLNKPITTLAAASLPGGRGLVSGTAVGSIIAFNLEGRRLWSRFFDDARIVNLSPASFSPADGQPTLSAVIAKSEQSGDPSDVLLFSETGQVLDTYSGVDTTGLTQLTDMNHDRHSELLLARFAQVELRGLGIGASETAGDWDFNLFAQPTSILVSDFDLDGREEIVLGDRNGRIRRLDGTGRLLMLVNPGGAITHLAQIQTDPDDPPDIVALRQQGSRVNPESWLELRRPNGDQVWEKLIPGEVTSLLVDDFTERGVPEILLGTAEGRIFIYSETGTLVRQTAISESIHSLLLLHGDEKTLLANAGRQVYRINMHGTSWRLAVSDTPILSIFPLEQQESGEPMGILVISNTGTIRGYTLAGRRIPRYSLALAGKPTAVFFSPPPATDFPANNSSHLFITTSTELFINLDLTDFETNAAWELEKSNLVTNLYWGDLDGNALPDMAIGQSDGSIQLYRFRFNNEPILADELAMTGSIFSLTAVHARPDAPLDLLAVSQTGLVRLFRAQQNRPPLLFAPATDVAPGRYNILVTARDVENDPVQVRLDIQNPRSGEWIDQGTRDFTGGSETLFWPLDSPPAESEALHYRFFYNDGFHQGFVTPPPGPAAILMTPLSRFPLINLGWLAAAGLVIAAIILRQAQLPATQARRFYRRLKKQAPASLTLLERRYRRVQGSPDFLLYLANEARQQNDTLIANLADGLYLLKNRTQAGMSILDNGLGAIARLELPWQGLARWRMMYRVLLSLLEAPSITELGLLRPQLAELLDVLDEEDEWSPALNGLLPILTSIRDSERVESAHDSLVYLNEAHGLIDQLAEQLPELSVTIEVTLATAVLERVRGLVGADIEELRGRAELAIALKTRRLVPTAETEVVLEIRNDGRAPAENLIAELAASPAYGRKSEPQVIRLLPPGHTRQVSFCLEPRVSDRFRLAMTITYNDRNRQDKRAVFADMVHLLPPQRTFKPIPNPYLPGTPLRKNSPLFYGREELFQFIAENAGHLAQRNVLILIGQRRTGKTSVLLRLEQHLPGNLIPVYIDCQSLGVGAGLPALLNDLAWYITDALSARGIEMVVPKMPVWQEDPTGTFQRNFLPLARKKLPANATLLLVFDEFETLENLVDDGMLPPNLFPYLRHLMQHSEGLSFVFVGSRRLEEMSADYWSVLFNIALYQRIGYLSDTAARRLISEPVKPNLVYDDLALDKILRVTSGHPYFLQLVCYTLVKRANTQRSGYATISDVNAALDEMLNLGEVHFAYLWQRSGKAERALLMAMAHLMDRDAPFYPIELTQYLEPYGIHFTPAEITAALNKLVERGIIREVPEAAATSYELGIGLVGLWVARHKSLSHLYSADTDKRKMNRKKAVS